MDSQENGETKHGIIATSSAGLPVSEEHQRKETMSGAASIA